MEWFLQHRLYINNGQSRSVPSFTYSLWLSSAVCVLTAEKVQEVKKNFLQESGMHFSDLEEKVLQFHLSNLEFACGSTLDQVTFQSKLHFPDVS